MERGSSSPRRALDQIVDVLHHAEDLDAAAGEVGCGDLEDLFHAGHEKELWPEIERLARADPIFRRALRAAWAYDSPMFERREALLQELGEWRTTWVRFVVAPEFIGRDTPLSWRAVELEGSVRGSDLAKLLRSIADWAERPDRGT